MKRCHQFCSLHYYAVTRHNFMWQIILGFKFNDITHWYPNLSAMQRRDWFCFFLHCDVATRRHFMWQSLLNCKCNVNIVWYPLTPVMQQRYQFLYFALLCRDTFSLYVANKLYFKGNDITVWYPIISVTKWRHLNWQNILYAMIYHFDTQTYQLCNDVISFVSCIDTS